jgi:hypothetical protein
MLADVPAFIPPAPQRQRRHVVMSFLPDDDDDVSFLPAGDDDMSDQEVNFK